MPWDTTNVIHSAPKLPRHVFHKEKLVRQVVLLINIPVWVASSVGIIRMPDGVGKPI